MVFILSIIDWLIPIFPWIFSWFISGFCLRWDYYCTFIAGKDITQKLYALNEHLSGLSDERQRGQRNQMWAKSHNRSMSMDAVNTGTTGLVRSQAYKLSHKNSSVNADSKYSFTFIWIIFYGFHILWHKIYNSRENNTKPNVYRSHLQLIINVFYGVYCLNWKSLTLTSQLLRDAIKVV